MNKVNASNSSLAKQEVVLAFNGASHVSATLQRLGEAFYKST
ncbi:hypothetical protein [Chryseolinea lacunae]|nr:hypothetical protein [Chryseolinea lacunae]